MRTSNSTLVEQLRESLSKHIVKFSYRKADGSVRDAIGTRNLALVFKSTGVTIPTPKTGRENINAYFDIEKMGWRSFIPSNVIMMNYAFLDDAKFRDFCKEQTPKADMPTRDTILVSDEEILKTMGDIDKDIEIPVRGGCSGGVGGGLGIGVHYGFSEGNGGKPLGGGQTPKGKEEPTDFDLGKIKGMLGLGMGKVGTPTDMGYGIGIPVSGVGGKEMTIDDFAKLVAKYVVAELANKLGK